MSSPQCEDGYTKIANELLDALCNIRIPGEAMQVFLVIMRKTYGYNKKTDAIALSQFAFMTGLAKPHIIRAIDKLKAMNIIFAAKKGNELCVSYEINKDFSLWMPLPKKGTSVAQKGNKVTTCNDSVYENGGIKGKDESLPIKAINVPNKGNESLPIKGTTKETPKEIKTVPDAKTISEQRFVSKFDEKKERITELYPLINFEIEREKCIAYYRNRPEVLDPWLKILDWFGRAKAQPPNVSGYHPPDVTVIPPDMGKHMQKMRELGYEV